jgi:hypothetical protein
VLGVTIRISPNAVFPLFVDNLVGTCEPEKKPGVQDLLTPRTRLSSPSGRHLKDLRENRTADGAQAAERAAQKHA